MDGHQPTTHEGTTAVCFKLAFVHDELQFECDPTHAQDLCSSLVLSATEAGEYYKMRIKIDAEATTGKTGVKHTNEICSLQEAFVVGAKYSY